MKQRLIVAAIGVPLTFCVIWFAPFWLYCAIMVLLFGYCVFELLSVGKTKWFTIATVPMIVLACALMIVQGTLRHWIFLIIGCAYIGDAGAMLTGKFIGPHWGGGHPFPHISPKKTYAGLVGGVVVPMVFAVVVYPFITTTHLVIFPLVVGFVLGVAAICGDLYFSMIKRKLGIKDYGTLLPGHGGVLDRFDSMMFVAPVSALILLFAMAHPTL